MRRTHLGQHGPDCFGCKVQTVSVMPSAMPTRHPHCAQTKIGDQVLAKDLDAFKRLAQEGHMPPKTKGAADVEKRANEHFEIERAMLVEDRSTRNRFVEAIGEVADMEKQAIPLDEARAERMERAS